MKEKKVERSQDKTQCISLARRNGKSTGGPTSRSGNCVHIVSEAGAKGATHKKGEKSEEENQQAVPVISSHYMGKQTRDERSQRGEASAIK